MRRILNALTGLLAPPRVIYDREGGSPYLSRYYLIGDRPEVNETGNVTTDPPKPGLNLYLHRFHRSDDDGALHSHPWAWAISLRLAGAYSEERRVGDRVIRRVLKPGRAMLLRGTDYHRVDLLEEDAWSLFLAGPKVSTWYFWDRVTKMRVEWSRFIAEKRGLLFGDAVGWEPDLREPGRHP